MSMGGTSVMADDDDDVLVAMTIAPSATRSPMRAALGKQLSFVFDSALGQVSRPAAAADGGGASKSVEPVSVFLRLRPLPEGEESAIEVLPDQRSVRATAPAALSDYKQFAEPREYSFTRVMDESTSQETMYAAAAEDIVSQFCREGKSGLIFTYGVTNAGKSHTVLGSKEQPGILPRSIGSVIEDLDMDQVRRGEEGGVVGWLAGSW